MKKLYLLPLALLILASCKDDKKAEQEKPAVDFDKTDWNADKLKGEVKSVSQKSFAYNGGVKGASANEPGMYDIDLQYNATGMLVSEKKYNGSAILQEHTYNGRKKPIKEIQYTNGTPGVVTEYTYNKDGNTTSITKRTGSNAQIERIEKVYKGKNLVELNTYNNQNTPLNKITYSYDKDGNVIEENVYGEMQVAKIRAEYGYNSNGHKTSEKRFNDGKLEYKIQYNYDGDRLMSEITSDDKEGLIYSKIFGYDANGNITKNESFEKSTNIRSEEVNTYDANNNIATSTITENKKLLSKTLYTYDTNNNLTSVKSIDGTGKIIYNRSYNYTYDDKNNWIKKEVIINGQPAFVVQRTIQYY